MKGLEKNFGRFCDAKIDMIVDINIDTTNQKFKNIKDHSSECYKLEEINFENNEAINEWEDFKNKSINYSNNIKGEFNTKSSIDNLEKIIEESKYDFIFNNIGLDILTFFLTSFTAS